MAVVTFNVEDDLREKVQEVMDSIGIDMQTTLTIFLKQIARENRIPVDLYVDTTYEDNFYSKSNMYALRESIEQYNI